MERYKYYSVLRPIEAGSFPKPPDNPPLEIINYDVDSRISVKGEIFDAWGELIYAKPLTERQQYDYELRPSRLNRDVQDTMERQAQVIGPWETYRRRPEEERVTEYDPISGKYRPKAGVSPLLLNSYHNSAQKFPVPKPRRKKASPQHGER